MRGSDMRQWEQHKYGGADVLELRESATPTPRSGEIVVQCGFASVNSGDVRVMRGDPRIVRAFFGIRRPRTKVRGMDVAGVVISVAPDVTTVAVGDRVVGEAPGGAFAEAVRLRADRVVPLPDAVDLAAAATLPVAAGTAALAIDRTAVQRRDAVLVLGASGGVGSFAVQLSVARGAHVTAIARAEAHEAIARLGASNLMPRGVTPLELAGAGPFDVVLDVSGTIPLRRLKALTKPGGRVALISGAGGSVLGPLPRLVRALMLSRQQHRLIPISAMFDGHRLRSLVDLLESGALTPLVSHIADFHEIPSAVAALDRGGVTGKVLVRIAGESA